MEALLPCCNFASGGEMREIPHRTIAALPAKLRHQEQAPHLCVRHSLMERHTFSKEAGHFFFQCRESSNTLGLLLSHGGRRDSDFSWMEGLSVFSPHSDCVQGSASLAQGLVPVVWPEDFWQLLVRAPVRLFCIFTPHPGPSSAAPGPSQHPCRSEPLDPVSPHHPSSWWRH